MKKNAYGMVLATLLVLSTVFFLLSPPIGNASPTPSGTCFLSGPATVNTTVSWTNLHCTHDGPITITGSGSLTLINSSLVQNGNATTSTITVNLTGRLNMLHSGLTFNNSSGTLDVRGASTVHLSKTSSITNGHLKLEQSGLFSSNESSFLNNLVGLDSLSTATMVLNSTTLSGIGGNFTVGGNRLAVIDSILSFANLGRASFSAQSISITGSKIVSSNVSLLQIGNSSLANSVTAIASSILVANGPNSTTVGLGGATSLSIVNSTVSNAVSSFGSAPVGTVSLIGGKVSILKSQILSSCAELYGYVPNSRSVLNVSANVNLAIGQSQLIAGQTQTSGTFRFSTLQLLTRANMTVSNSLLQSLSFAPDILVGSIAPSLSGYVWLNQTQIEMLNNTGSITLKSSYSVSLYRSSIHAPFSSLKPLVYLLQGRDSSIAIANATSSLTFGSGVTVGIFYNTAIGACSVSPCLRALHSGSFSTFGWLNVQVVSHSSNQTIPGANVIVIDPKTTLTAYSAITNATGWIRIPALISQVTPTKTISNPTYMVQASYQGEESPQRLLTSNNTFSAVLSVDKPADLTNVNATGFSALGLARTYNLVNSSYLIPPPGLYNIGQYLASQYVPTVTIVSNAAQLNFRNNASRSEIDFTTAGGMGDRFYFVVIYPKNFTEAPVQVRVDSSYIQIRTQSNSTHGFAIFSAAPGYHVVAITYTPVNGNFAEVVQYPQFYPSRDTIIAVSVLAFIGIVFLLLYARRNDRKGTASSKPPAQPPPK